MSHVSDVRVMSLILQVMALAKKICIKAACGGQHSLVLTDANKLYGWGSNTYGQLGMNINDRAMLSPDIVPSLRRSGSCHVVCGYRCVPVRCENVYVCMYVYMYVCMCIYICIYIYMCVCVCVCIHTYMYIHIHVHVSYKITQDEDILTWCTTCCMMRTF
jgi:hypothetical protein